MARNILIFSDGTGQVGGYEFDEDRTNVYKLYRATRVGPDSCIDPHVQAAFYDPGLGSRGQGGFPLGRLVRWIYRKVSQATGLGITRNITDCYAAIIRLAKPDDRIFFFEFSRGAYTVRCVAAALFGLAGLQDPIARDPFGAATIAVDYGQLAAIWRDERAQLVADAEAVTACPGRRCAGLRSRRDAARHCHRSETVSGQGADRPHKPRYQFAHTTDARRVGWRA
jgi:Uncharacterized alpha/beta hydrolase domain (DUF2235)